VWPLAQLPVLAACWTWRALEIASLAAFVLWWRGAAQWSNLLAVCCSLPAVMCFSIGQDAIFLLLFAAMASTLAEDYPCLAGLALSLCASKYHLCLLLPVALLAQRRWKVTAGAALGFLSLLLISFASAGWRWPGMLLANAANPATHPHLTTMPNLHGLLTG